MEARWGVRAFERQYRERQASWRLGFMEDREMEQHWKWLAGIDWAREKHHVCLMDGRGQVHGERSFPHDGAGLAALADWLLSLTGGPPAEVHVAIETPEGPVVESLMGFGFALHAINPKQLDRFRDRHSPAGAKDDSRDAWVLSDALRTDPHCFRQLRPQHASQIELRACSRLAEELKVERGRLACRMREQLWRYYPQFPELVGEVADDWALALWRLLPTPQKARRVRPDSIAKLLKAHRIRRLDAEAVRQALAAPAPEVTDGTVDAACRHLNSLVHRIRLLNRQRRQCQKDLDRLTQAYAASLQEQADGPPGQRQGQRDVAILKSLPGIARTNLAALLAEAPEALQRRDYHALRCLCGTAPVTRQSGKTRIVSRRLAVNWRLVNAVYHWAMTAIQHDPKSKAKYYALRQKGHSHGRALRSVSDRLLAVACAMLRDHTLYDPRHNQHAQT